VGAAAGKLRSAAGNWRVLLSALAILALALAPFTFDLNAHTAQNHADAASGAHGDHGGSTHHGESDHALSHCGGHLCAPAFVDAPQMDAAAAVLTGETGMFPRDESLLRPLYLGSDPPVPRPGLTEA
jgi:hypothetical protein